MKKLIVLLSMFFVGTLYAQSMVTSGDINKSMVTDYKQFFTKENCNQVLIDTFSICYDWKRKSPTPVYVEVTGEDVVKDIEKRPPFFTDKRVKKQYRTTSKDYTKSGYDRGHFGKSDASHDWNKKHQKATYSMSEHRTTNTTFNRYKFIVGETRKRDGLVKHGRLENVTYTGMLNQRLSVSRNSMYHRSLSRFSLVKDIVNVSSSGIQKSTMKVTDKTQTNTKSLVMTYSRCGVQR